MGEICPPPPIWGRSAGGQSITGENGTHEGDIDLIGGRPTLIDYTASEKYCYCQAAMQFICYDPINLLIYIL